MMNSGPHRLKQGHLAPRRSHRPAYGEGGTSAYGEGGTLTATRRFLRRGCGGMASAGQCLLARRRHRCAADPVSGGRWPSHGSAGACPERRLGCPRLAKHSLSGGGIAGAYGWQLP